MHRFLATALRHPVSAIGVALTTASAAVFVLLLALQLLGFLDNPYVGILVFILVPALFLGGLALVPIGVSLERKRRRDGGAGPWLRFDLNDPRTRRTLALVSALTLVNLVIVALASYGAVQYTESQAFCGQVCHQVMEPEFVAHQAGLHGRVACVACHVGPGAQGFVAAKLSGTRQLAGVLTGRYPRPIPTPVANLPAVAGSCESCHQPDRFIGDVLKVIYEHADDEANTRTATTLRLHVGGPIGGTGTGSGIHWHMTLGNQVDYVAADDSREQILYVRASTPGGPVREYFADGVADADLAGRPRRRMDCVDCHSRPAHRFAASPEREVDAALGGGEISQAIPFIRRDAVRALRGEYESQAVAMQGIERTIREAAHAGPPAAVDEAALRQAIAVTQRLYRINVFPGMKVGWGTYPDQLGHVTATGCFRCHDDGHKTREGLAIRQDCELCHTIE